eukprot:CAMPEP_0183375372 /NCGR_PEP_ID=MMETSP0164_2-20130417/117127_1 /TAXON_ID=221442 /ORGANISM="Coccolithus pelagicus ssp braarudi, Strain PLY182g" /LENGTH=78 /DNA_ID=CAMNT_0025552537 /DNA_START=66 /DNA_END=302 /DNA_ORIENTATION=-
MPHPVIEAFYPMGILMVGLCVMGGGNDLRCTFGTHDRKKMLKDRLVMGNLLTLINPVENQRIRLRSKPFFSSKTKAYK